MGCTTAIEPAALSRKRTVGEGDLQHAGAGAEGGERLGLAEDAVERDILLLAGRGRGGDDLALAVGEVDAAAGARGARRQRVGERFGEFIARRRRRRVGVRLVERARKHGRHHADRLAGVVLALGFELRQLDEARQPDHDQEDRDENRDQSAEQRLGGQQTLVGGLGEEPRMAGDNRPAWQAQPGKRQMFRDRWRGHLCLRHAGPLDFWCKLPGNATPESPAFESTRIGLSRVVINKL
jgi:hypothetical protein